MHQMDEIMKKRNAKRGRVSSYDVTGGNDDRLALIFIAVLGSHHLIVSLVADAIDRLDLHLSALSQRLLHKVVCQLTAADRVEAGIVLHLGREGDLTAKGGLF